MRGYEKSNAARTQWKTVTVGWLAWDETPLIRRARINYSLVLYSQGRVSPEPNMLILATKG